MRMRRLLPRAEARGSRRRIHLVGTPVILSARGANLPPGPLYQFWIESPAGVWRAVQGYGPTATLSWIPRQPGTYHVAAYSLARTLGLRPSRRLRRP